MTTYADKFTSPGNTYTDPFSSQGNSYSDKFSTESVLWDDIPGLFDSGTAQFDSEGVTKVYNNKY